MEYLPTREDQLWLLRELAAIVRVRGAEQFLQSPIVEPTPEFFPDPVTSLWTGLDRVTRRLMQYAGLGGLDLTIEAFEGDDDELHDASAAGEWRRCVAGVFAGIEGGRCRFGINAGLKPDLEDLAGVMAHEVAHAYRCHHQLQRDDRDAEELATDITAAYLGFGILTANNSHRYRKEGSQQGQYAVTSWSSSAFGYIPTQHHCFLLAAQIVARGRQPSPRKAIYRQLETNQAAFVKAAVRELEQDEQGLATALGILSMAPVGAARRPEEILTVLEPLPVDTSPTPFESARKWNRGEPIFRIRHTREFAMPWFATCVGVIAVVASTAWLTAWSGAVAAVLAGVIESRWRGKRYHRYDRCSDRSCALILAPDLARCPNCGGEVIGTLDSLESALEMSDKIKEARKDLGR